jgi:hypothetical protein
MNNKEKSEKLLELLRIFEATTPGTPEEKAAWKAYQDFLNKCLTE